jgi:hypothetical protein
MNLVSATVYLRPDQLELIKQNCCDTNRRISDLIFGGGRRLPAQTGMMRAGDRVALA